MLSLRDLPFMMLLGSRTEIVAFGIKPMSPQTRQPITDPDGVRWNAGAWFGSQLGGTAWMLTAFAAYVWQLPWIGGLSLITFIGINGLGFWLWRQRRRLRFFRSVQLLTILCGGSALLALVALDFLPPENLKHNLVWRDSQLRWVGADRSEFRSAYLLLAVMVPALLLLFEVQGRQARRNNRSGD